MLNLQHFVKQNIILKLVIYICNSDVVAQIEHEDMAVMGHIRPDEWVRVQKHLARWKFFFSVWIYFFYLSKNSLQFAKGES